MAPAMPFLVRPGSQPLRETGHRPGTGELSDAALLERVGAGDEAAAAEFVERFQRRVFGLAVTIVTDRVAAEDVAQEALLRAWRHAGAYDPRRGSVVTWLLTIT